MPERQDNPIVFEEPGQVLTALALLTPGTGPLPEKILYTTDGKWSVAPTSFGSGSIPERKQQLRLLAQQHGWRVSFPDHVYGEFRPTTTLLVGRWVYCDPLCAAEWSGHTAAPPPEGSWAWLDPSIPRTQFLLGAKDDTRAQRIIDVLAAHQAQGIRGIPILLRPASGVEHPFRFYWNIFLDRPNPFLFQAADGVWWGPCGHGRTQIFLAYPYSLAVPIEVLHRFQWRPDTGVVLLSEEPPKVVELSLSPGGDVFAEFPGLIRLDKGEAQVNRPVAQTQDSPQAKFTIELHTGGPDPSLAIRQRIEGLRKEIHAKQQLLEDMIARAGIETHDDAAPEPLFLFAQQPADRGHIPREIQQLLLEWADQPEDLGAVYYAFLPGGNLPPGLFLPNTSLHVITSSTALGKPGSFSVGARLLDYAPRTQNSWNLELNAGWAEHRLHLFFPTTGHFWLYPNLRPTNMAAGKLSAALLPELNMSREDHLFLLLPGYRKLQCMVLSRSDFHPLSEAFRWVLDIDAGINLPVAASTLRDKVAEAVREAVGENFYRAVKQEANTRRDEITGLLATRVSAIASGIEQRNARIGQLEQISKDYQEVIAQIGVTVGNALAESKALDDLLERVEEHCESTGAHLSAIRKTVEDHEKLRTSLRDLSSRVSEIRGRIEKP